MGKDPFGEFRGFINTMESRVQVLGRSMGLGIVAGLRILLSSICLTIQDKEIFYQRH